jgi:hypothetical protein
MVSALIRRQIHDPESGAPTASRLLIALLGAPSAWSVHLFASYSLVGIECNGGMSGAALALSLAGATILLGGFALWCGLTAYRMAPVQQGQSWRALASDTIGRVHFFAGTGALLSTIFVLLIVLQAIAPLVVPLCPEVLRVAR